MDHSEEFESGISPEKMALIQDFGFAHVDLSEKELVFLFQENDVDMLEEINKAVNSTNHPIPSKTMTVLLANLKDNFGMAEEHSSGVSGKIFGFTDLVLEKFNDLKRHTLRTIKKSEPWSPTSCVFAIKADQKDKTRISFSRDTEKCTIHIEFVAISDTGTDINVCLTKKASTSLLPFEVELDKDTVTREIKSTAHKNRLTFSDLERGNYILRFFDKKGNELAVVPLLIK